MEEKTNTPAKDIFNSEISSQFFCKLQKLFFKIDIKKTNSIDKKSTSKFFRRTLPKINTVELFCDVDNNNDDIISFKEWEQYWIGFLKKGYNEKYLEEIVIL